MMRKNLIVKNLTQRFTIVLALFNVRYLMFFEVTKRPTKSPWSPVIWEEVGERVLFEKVFSMPPIPFDIFEGNCLMLIIKKAELPVVDFILQYFVLKNWNHRCIVLKVILLVCVMHFIC